MGRSISPMREAKLAGSDPTAAPRLIVPMSLRLAIPRRVALQQSSPPLHQPGVILKQKEQLGKENPSNGKCASSQLSQPRGSPQKPVLLDRAGVVWSPRRDFADECDGCQNGRSIKGSLIILVLIEKDSSNGWSDY